MTSDSENDTLSNVSHSVNGGGDADTQPPTGRGDPVNASGNLTDSSLPPDRTAQLTSLVTQCRIAMGDLMLSQELVETGISENNTELVRSEQNDFEKMVSDFNVPYLRLIELCQKDNVGTAEHEERRKKFMVTLKNLKSKVSKYLSDVSGTGSTESAESDALSRLKYSKIDIKTFSGDKFGWQPFKAAFTTYYHASKLSDLEKHQVLFTKTSGEANDLIREFPLNGKHYNDAWRTLLDHYDDPLKIVARHLDALSSTAAIGVTKDGKNQKKQTLRSLITHFRPNVTAIQMTFTDNPEIDSISQFFIHQFLSKVDQGTRLAWEAEMEKRKSFATFKEFLTFMESRCNAYERATETSQSQKVLTIQHQPHQQRSKENFNCYYCNGNNHYLHRCIKFKDIKPEERSSFIRKKRLCPRCFKGKCERTCSITCKSCNGRHNTLIHLENYSATARSKPSSSQTNTTGESAHVNVCNRHANVDQGPLKNMNKVSSETIRSNSSNLKLMPEWWVGSVATDNLNALLATARVAIKNAKKSGTTGRALLDSASELNFITTEFANKLNTLPFNSYKVFHTIQHKSSSTNQATLVNLKSIYSEFNLSIQCVIVDEIVELVPNQYFSIEEWDFPNYVKLADPEFHIPANVDLLFGASVFWKILKPQILKMNKNLPNLFASHFRWLVAGDITAEPFETSNSHYIFLEKEEQNGDAFKHLLNTIEKLWIIPDSENFPEWTLEELECEKHYVKNTFRDKQGNFIVKNPFKISPHNLGETRVLALKRFYSLERKMIRNEKFKKLYVDYIRDLIIQNHMREVVRNPGEFENFIPHHGIVKESSTSTPVRPVFDASMLTSTGLSLNDCLMKGPTIQSDLVSIILRSRIHSIMFSADIKQMYRRVKINEADYPFQRIFWRENPSDELKVYELTTVIFGLKSAPFLATRCLKKLADDQGDKYPAARGPLLNDFYVDDVFTGADSLDEVQKIKDQLVEILTGAGFELTKWCSNSKELLQGIPAEKLDKNFPLYNDNEFATKTPGIIWLPEEDSYRVWVNLKKLTKYTKRSILSVVASVFDPLGFLSPVTIIAKLIMQSLWVKTSKNGSSWDLEVSDTVKQEWLKFSTHLQSLNNLSVHRNLFYQKKPKIVELHGFADASEKAYGAVIYLRGIDNNNVTATLYCSKTKVAPLKRQTLARLELCAALLLAELLAKVYKAVDKILEFNVVRLWSDSEITLCWINSPSKKWQVFVANRVEKIQRLTLQGQWDYVKSEENPADILSRGIKPENLKDCNLWWHGPEWLSNSVIPFDTHINFKNKKNQCVEVRNSRKFLVCTATNFKQSEFFARYSNYSKLVRITAWCLRFIWNFHWHGPFLKGPLHIFEIQQATAVLIKLVQQEFFPAEIKALKNNREISPKSSIISLSPFLDALEILRVGGRLKNSELSYEQRHPILLPSQHPFTKLLVNYEHIKHQHAGPNLLRSVLRRNYWILQHNKAIQSCILRCFPCIRQKAVTRTQIMGALPKARVIPARAFQNVGIDYAGPFKLLRKGQRKRVTIDCYVGVFVCFTTKAIHLELISDLTSESFLAAFTRFSSRRGLPLNIYSDNGPTFQGAKTKLRELKEFFDKNGDSISKQIIERGCQWHFIPPYSPHFGGLWEAGVKSVKSHLKPVLGSAMFTYEQYETLLTQIEACLNSRPLTAESSDPNEPGALTPGHFLIGGPITALPNPDLTNVPMNRLKYWELVKQQAREFWNRWSRDYLHTLQQKGKWKQLKNDFKVGDLVLVKEENNPPTIWPLGQIIKVDPGSDGLIRVVTVRMRSGSYENFLHTDESLLKRDRNNAKKGKKPVAKMTEMTRPITKLVYLPFEECANN